MKKIFKILLYIILAILLFIGGFIALFLYGNYAKKKEIAEERLMRLAECNKDIYITTPLNLELVYFNDSDIDTLTFEIIRNNKVVRDTTVIEAVYQTHISSVEIPFEKFQISDTIRMITKNGFKFNLSSFRREVNELYGMFGPVAISDCFVIDRYTINEIQNTKTINKFFGYWEPDGDSIKRISVEHPDFKKLTRSYPITSKKVNELGSKIYSKYHKASSGLTIGLEISPQKSYYIVGFRLEDKFEIIKIDTQTGAQSKRLTNYPIENEF